MINEEFLEHSPHKVLICGCKALLASTRCTLKHTFREGNQVTDRLANMGVNQEDKMVSHVIQKDDIIPLLETDMKRYFSHIN